MSAPKNDISATEARRLLRYSPHTGGFAWAVDVPPNAKAGDVAGSRSAQGYWRITIGNRTYCAHRLAWLIVTGQWPRQQIDHRDNDKTNNRWANLREAAPRQNLQNIGKTARNSTGYKGVSRNQASFKATIRIEGVNTHLGTYRTAEAAAAAYRQAASVLHGDFLHPSVR